MNSKSATLLLAFLTGMMSFSSAQNTTSIWKHSCNCGQAEMVIQDSSQNTWVMTENSANSPRIIKLNNSGGQVFNNNYMPAGYNTVLYANMIYRNTKVYLAGQASSATLSDNLFITRIDASGATDTMIVIDSIHVNSIAGIKSAPPYSFGMGFDLNNNLHISFIKYDANFLGHYCFLTLDSNLNYMGYFEEPMTYVSSAGPTIIAPNGSIYYTHTGFLNKLNSTYTGIEWSVPLANYSYGKMLQFDGGNIYMMREEYTGAVFNYSLMKVTDNGSTYTINYDTLTGFGYNSAGPAYKLFLADNNSNAIYSAGNDYTMPPYKYYIHKHNATTGELLWEDSSATGQMIFDLQLSAEKNIIALGGGTNYYAYCYNNSGQIVHTILYDGVCGSGGNDAIASSVMDASGKLIVTGSSCESFSTVNYGTTIKYNIPLVTDVAEVSDYSPIFLYPQPANDILYYKSEVPVISTKAIDVTGKEYILKAISADAFSTSELASGLYFIQLKTKHKTLQQKVIVVH